MNKLFSSSGGGSLLIPVLVALPIIFSILIGLGFTRNDIIEDARLGFGSRWKEYLD
jgi:hypothetical protein